MVLLDLDLNATEMWEADRSAVNAVLTKPGSIVRNKRGSMAVSQFKRIGKLVWRRPESRSVG